MIALDVAVSKIYKDAFKSNAIYFENGKLVTEGSLSLPGIVISLVMENHKNQELNLEAVEQTHAGEAGSEATEKMRPKSD